MRILDLDLDFFMERAGYLKASNSERLNAQEYPPWSRDDAMAFLEQRCKLTAKHPGFVVEHHGELFPRWLAAIEAGRLEPPFAVTHVDAHADLGMGDHGYVYLMTELLFRTPAGRRFPKTGPGGLDDGNWLIFAIACRWLSDLVYVLNTETGPPTDRMFAVMEGFDLKASHVQLAAIDKSEVSNLLRPSPAPRVVHLEPKVPFRWVPWKSFEASEPYDVICLARSPGFTCVELDPLFDEIRNRFIDESAFT